jgi:hypothetical protein
VYTHSLSSLSLTHALHKHTLPLSLCMHTYIRTHFAHVNDTRRSLCWTPPSTPKTRKCCSRTCATLCCRRTSPCCPLMRYIYLHIIHTYTHTYIHTHKRTHIHTHTYIYTQTRTHTLLLCIFDMLSFDYRPTLSSNLFFFFLDIVILTLFLRSLFPNSSPLSSFLSTQTVS